MHCISAAKAATFSILWYADQHADIDWPRVMDAFHQIMEKDGNPVTDKQLRLNLEEKLEHPDFLAAIENLLICNESESYFNHGIH